MASFNPPGGCLDGRGHSLARRTIILAALLILLTSGSSQAQAPGADIVAAARAGLPTFLADGRELQHFGFNSRAEAERATLGEAFQVHTIRTDVLLNSTSVRSLRSLAVPTDLWAFLVLKDGVPAAVLTVDLTADGWKAVSISGAAGLARKLGAIAGAWPASARYRRTFIRIFQVSADFVEIEGDAGVLGNVPFRPGPVSGAAAAFQPAALHSAADTVLALRALAQKTVGVRR